MTNPKHTDTSRSRTFYSIGEVLLWRKEQQRIAAIEKRGGKIVWGEG